MTNRFDEKVNPVTSALLAMITEGRLQAGSWIRESELAAHLGVSRTPIRDVLHELTGAGVIIQEPNRGARVRSYSHEQIEEIYRSRALVEPHLVAVAVPLMDARDVAQLKDPAGQMRATYIKSTSRHKLSQLNSDFHRCYVERVRDRPLASTAEILMVPLLVSKFMRSYKPEDIRRSMDHHDELIFATEMKDSERASSIMRNHILAV